MYSSEPLREYTHSSPDIHGNLKFLVVRDKKLSFWDFWGPGQLAVPAGRSWSAETQSPGPEAATGPSHVVPAAPRLRVPGD